MKALNYNGQAITLTKEFNGKFGKVELTYVASRESETCKLFDLPPTYIDSHFVCRVFDGKGDCLAQTEGTTEVTATVAAYTEIASRAAIDDLRSYYRVN